MTHLPDGTVELELVGAEDAHTVNPGDQYDNGCGDNDVINPYGFRTESPFDWKINTGTVPVSSVLTLNGAVDAIRDGNYYVVTCRNTCGFPDNAVNGYPQYAGTTTTVADIDYATTNCLLNDGNNEVSFGTLPSKYTAYACWWYRAPEPGWNKLLNGDIKINKSNHTWYSALNGAPCNGRYSLRATTTHEWGHLYGMAHQPEIDHPWLTMSGALNGLCQSSETTGYGDVRSIDYIY